ncbi:MAG: ABC transporter permease [Cytophagaceae bacterium]|nr:ABC transporter permease [Gemmatimonadaceae bacterium]
MLSRTIARMRSLLGSVRRRDHLDAEMDEEFRLHLELRAADLVRTGLSPAAATRQARLEFGGTERHKDAGAESLGLRNVDGLRVSWLDFKLGFRMLVRYPGLTLIGGLAMAFAIWIGAGAFELARQVVSPNIPLPDGNRIVALRNWDASRSRPEARVLHDLVSWKANLASVEDLGAFRGLQRNLITAGASGEPVEVAEISASAFRLTRVPPLMGRALVEADESPGAPDVVVIGHDVWQRRFQGDTAVIGKTLRLATTVSTVVGVMPEGYAFPVNQEFWVPLRLDASSARPREGPELSVFARLAPGASLGSARTELEAIGIRATRELAETHEHLRPQVMPLAESIVRVNGWFAIGVMSMNIPLVLLVILICGNVALLMFARAATRETEIAVRSALGAGRGRIIMQLFAEALVLGGFAAVIGLAAAGAGLRWVMGVVEAEFLEGAQLPFWFQDHLSPLTLFYAALLTLLSAVIAGVVPALKVTRGGVARLKQSSAGRGSVRFGGIWTAVIVAQVAVTVAFPVAAWFVRRDARLLESADFGFPAREFLSARLEMDHDPATSPADAATFATRYRSTWNELSRRISEDPAVTAVTYADRLPYMYHPHRLIEVDDGGAAPIDQRWPRGYRVTSASVDPDFFRTFDAPVLSGRAFTMADYSSSAGPGDVVPTGGTGGPVIVNEPFVRLVMGNRNPIGRRLRYVDFEETPTPEKAGPWFEIIGVVKDLGTAVGADVGQAAGGDPKVAGLYHPIAPGASYPGHVAVRVRGDVDAFASRLRRLATTVDPTLRIYQMMPLADLTASDLRFLDFWFRLVLFVSALALVLSLAGIYAVMSFTVARRTREIGVRVALGAEPGRVIAAIFVRPLMQVSGGVILGGAIVAVLVRGVTGGFGATEFAYATGYLLLMLSVCLLACIVPTRRALGVQPTEALRSDA